MNFKITKLMMIAVAVLCLAPRPAVAEADCEERKSGNSSFAFSNHKSNYILYRPGSQESMDIKIQISAKFQIFNDDQLYKWTVPLYLGFTQKSYWAIGQPSMPFTEHDFNPELFLCFQPKEGEWELGGEWKVSDLRVGFYEHESTGVAGPNSKSWNRTYIKPTIAFRDDGEWDVKPYDIFGRPDMKLKKKVAPFSVSLKLWHIWTASGNKDVADYFGHGELTLQAATKREVLTVAMRRGTKHGMTYQVDFAVQDPIFRLFNLTDLNFVWLVQYHNGFGDGLVNYNVKDESTRFGVLFTF